MSQKHEVAWTEDSISRIWDYYSNNPAYQNQYFSFHSGKYIIDYINRHIDLKDIKTVLDFGCGPGFLLGHLLKTVKQGKCFGLDFSREAAARTNEKFKKEHNFAKALWTKELPSPIGSNSMEVVVLAEVIEHLNDEQLDSTLEDIRRVLKDKGCIVITTKNKEDLEADKTICPECGCTFHRWQHMRTWNADTLKKALEKKGFKTLDISECVFGSGPKRLYWSLNKSFRNQTLPHLAYIGKVNKI